MIDHKENRLLSVIIPAFNEASTIGECLEQFQTEKDVEIIVVDNGSSDDTRGVVEKFAGLNIKIAQSTQGRARSMNLGAEQASGDILLFLHADTLLPQNGLSIIKEAVQDNRYIGGFFRLRHECDLLSYKLLEPLINWRSKTTSIPLGDQAIFVRKDVFFRLGGYPDIPLMEDYEFSKTLYRAGQLFAVSDPVTTSARRFEKGVLRYLLLCNAIMSLYKMGFSPAFLKKFYDDSR